MIKPPCKGQYASSARGWRRQQLIKLSDLDVSQSNSEDRRGNTHSAHTQRTATAAAAHTQRRQYGPRSVARQSLLQASLARRHCSRHNALTLELGSGPFTNRSETLIVFVLFNLYWSYLICALECFFFNLLVNVQVIYVTDIGLVR